MFMSLTTLRAAISAAVVALATGMPVLSPANAHTPIDPGLADLVAKLLPSCVNITTTRYADVKLAPGQSVMQQKAQPGMTIWYGSGSIVRPDGIVVTNKHVVHNGVTFTVTMNDGQELPADLIAESVCCDIAVIKIRTDKPLPAVKVGDSDTVRQGDFVIAVGNPLHHTSTVTAGIISALNRDLGFTPFDDYMQTDASINEGNSGGPLFNAKGEVIGVNSSLYTTGTSIGSVGIGFAIPVNDAKYIVTHMREIQAGTLKAPYLGAQLQSLTGDLADAYGLPGPWGSMILKVADGSPAAAAGLRAGDIITTFGGKDVNDSRALRRAVVETPAGTTVDLGVFRNGKTDKVPVTLAALPAGQSYDTFLGQKGFAKPDIPASALANFGLETAAITPELRSRYHLSEQQQGAVVTGVAIASIAADAKINAGSVIVQVRDTPVTSPDQLWKQVADERQEKRPYVPVLLSEPSGLRWVSLRLD